MAELQRFIPRIYQNYNIDTVADVKSAVYQAMVRLFAQQCRNVDPQFECVAVPANPQTDFGAGGRYVDVVQANAYQSDDWVASINPGATDVLAVRLKPDTVAVAIAGFAVDTTGDLKPWVPIARINIYQDLTKQKPVRTLNVLPRISRRVETPRRSPYMRLQSVLPSRISRRVETETHRPRRARQCSLSSRISRRVETSAIPFPGSILTIKAL